MPVTIDLTTPGTIDPHKDTGRTLTMRMPQHPEYIFEWHPLSKKVYVACLSSKPSIGDVVAHDIENEGQARNICLIWSRGYQEAKTPRIGGLTLSDRRRENRQIG